jgi:hypothetical protein
MKYSLHQTRDNRYFKHGIQILGTMLEFHDVRCWATDTYGIGNDIDRDDPINNTHWAFFIKFQHYMIYLKGDDELAWFKLKYGQEA